MSAKSSSRTCGQHRNLVWDLNDSIEEVLSPQRSCDLRGSGLTTLFRRGDRRGPTVTVSHKLVHGAHRCIVRWLRFNAYLSSKNDKAGTHPTTKDFGNSICRLCHSAYFSRAFPLPFGFEWLRQNGSSRSLYCTAPNEAWRISF